MAGHTIRRPQRFSTAVCSPCHDAWRAVQPPFITDDTCNCRAYREIAAVSLVMHFLPSCFELVHHAA
jgi:hypothetical protein